MYYKPIDKKIFNFILNKINNSVPKIRKSKYTNEYYLEKIIFILRSGCTFRDANDTNIKNHYSSIHKKYRLWIKKNIFNNLFDDLIKTYKRKFLRHHRKSNLLELFIFLRKLGSTNIRNKNGSPKMLRIFFEAPKKLDISYPIFGGYQSIGRNYQDKFKNGNKVTIICDNNKFPLSMNIDKANIHDTNLVNKVVNNLQNTIPLNNIQLVGDKGYIMSDDKKKFLMKK